MRQLDITPLLVHGGGVSFTAVISCSIAHGGGVSFAAVISCCIALLRERGDSFGLLEPGDTC